LIVDKEENRSSGVVPQIPLRARRKPGGKEQGHPFIGE